MREKRERGEGEGKREREKFSEAQKSVTLYCVGASLKLSVCLSRGRVVHSSYSSSCCCCHVLQPRRVSFCCARADRRSRKFPRPNASRTASDVSPIPRPRVGVGRAAGGCVGRKHRQRDVQLPRHRRDGRFSRTLVQDGGSGGDGIKLFSPFV